MGFLLCGVEGIGYSQRGSSAGSVCMPKTARIIHTMRINLVAPFAEKDAVKALGARWDGAKKVWYIVDVTDLTPFMRWIPNLEAATDNSAGNPTRKPAAKSAAQQSPGVITKSSIEVPHCGCNVLPWEDCEHNTDRPIP